VGRIVKKYEIHIDDREFIAFRQLPGENASSGTHANLQRLLNETFLILKRFFDDVSREMFLAGFGDLLIEKHPSDAGLRIEQALLFLSKDLWSPRIYNLIGLEMIHGFLHDETYRAVLADSYGIDDLRFQALAGDVASFTPAALRGRMLLAEITRRAMWRWRTQLAPFWPRCVPAAEGTNGFVAVYQIQYADDVAGFDPASSGTTAPTAPSRTGVRSPHAPLPRRSCLGARQGGLLRPRVAEILGEDEHQWRGLRGLDLRESGLRRLLRESVPQLAYWHYNVWARASSGTPG